ncbi:EamA family transporter RarD [Novosphingobium piscinae]|uniref:EamA family transporter RarD n=1 Tax=Novosphingobium piscinae TaxID=1507448 RepID=A0A7X1G0I5_9SPHN|nr:EamA family transporter RarD [Novosphingobium piscinae]MBC2670386.1 EamA family transporter RarD [Novosphingobium piscinae]
MPVSPEARGNGLPQALGAYGLWGLLPLYLAAMHHVPPVEFVGWRIVFTLPVCLALVVAGRQAAPLLAVLRQPRALAPLLLSALLIGANWTIYVVAIHDGHVFAASIGYYINPLINVLLGTAVLGERLNRIQWLAVGIAAIGVGLLAVGALGALWVSLALALTFGFYGLVRKLAAVPAVTGLTVETLVLLPAALCLLGWFAAQPGGSALSRGPADGLLLAASGLVTAIPLLLFAQAAQRMDYSTLGFFQFLAPTLVFVEGLVVFDEPLSVVQLVCFAFIWTACAVYCGDLLRRRGAARG